MKKTVRTMLALLAILPGMVAAQGSLVGEMVYGPFVPPIPGLNGVMIAVLAVLVFALSFRALRRRTSGPLLSILAASLVTGLFSMAGVQLVSDSKAEPPSLYNPNGGSIYIIRTNNIYPNTSGVRLVILQINGALELCNMETSTCKERLVLAPGDSCNIDCSTTSPDP